MLRNYRRKIVRQIVFYIHTNILSKKRGQRNVPNIFFRNTRIVRKKKDCEKIVGKRAKKRFLYSHEYRKQKMGTKKCTNQFFQKHTIYAS